MSLNCQAGKAWRVTTSLCEEQISQAQQLAALPRELVLGLPSTHRSHGGPEGGGGEREYQLPRRSVCFGRDLWVTQERGKTTPVLRHLQPGTEKNRSEVRKVQESGEGLVMRYIIK